MQPAVIFRAMPLCSNINKMKNRQEQKPADLFFNKKLPKLTEPLLRYLRYLHCAPHITPITDVSLLTRKQS